MNISFYIFLLLLFPILTNAQCDTTRKTWEEESFIWKDDSEEKEQFALMEDAISAKNYKAAIKPIEWLLSNAPCLNKNTFLNAEKAYMALEKQAEGEEEIRLQDKLLALYDQRIQYFGERTLVRQKKGLRLYGYMLKRENAKELYYPKMFKFYQQLFDEAGTSILRANTVYYYDMAYQMYKLQHISHQQLDAIEQQVYDRIDKIIETCPPEKKEKWKSTKRKVQDKFHDCFPSYEVLYARMLQRIQENRYDIAQLKKAVKYLLANPNSTELKLFDETALQFAELGNYMVINVFAERLLIAGKDQKAIDLLKRCYPNCKTEEDKQAIKKKLESIVIK